MRKIVGIINCTPDSFYDGGKYFNPEDAIEHGIALADEGADILDIGGESTRPFSQAIGTEEELKRVLPVIKGLRQRLSIPLSIDTHNPLVAKSAIEEGATIVNDISGLSDPRMREIIAKHDIQAICMHMQGTPESMQINPTYETGIIEALVRFFTERLELCQQEGISKEKLIIDPGIGFGKCVEDNLTILAHIPKFCTFGVPVLIGLSRKSFMQKILGEEARGVLPTTLLLNTMSLVAGASLIRVHDVKEHRQILSLLKT